jgi:hypothetical protein
MFRVPDFRTGFVFCGMGASLSEKRFSQTHFCDSKNNANAEGVISLDYMDRP